MTPNEAQSDEVHEVADKAALLLEIRANIQDAWEHEKDNIREGTTDLEFITNNQWPSDVKREREAAGRPMLTINKLPQFLRQVTNDIRQADLAIKTSPVDEESDPELAKIYDGILMQIQYQSSARHVFSTAAEQQAGCGIGWFRIKTDYSADDAFEQDLKIEAIKNPLSVFWDPASILPDRSDATWIAVTETMPQTAFEKRYPGAAVESIQIPEDQSAWQTFWNVGKDVRIAEYWRKVPVERELALLADGKSMFLDELPSNIAMLPGLIVKRRMVKTHRVECYIASGSTILSGPHKWSGKYIPLVPVVGSEVALERRIYRSGVIRFAREPQQLYNRYRTAAAEAIALAPKAPWLVTADMIANHKDQWDNANRENLPYLTFDPDPTQPGLMPQRQAPVQMSAAFIQEAQIASEDMKATTGIYDASLGARSNETAGIAIRARQQEGDVANYHFIDNLKRSLEHAGRILLDLIPKIYDSQRVIRLMGDGDREQFVKINHEMVGPNGETIILNDLSTGKFDIRVTIGPNFATKRFEAASMMMEFIKAFPASAPLISDLVASMQDWPKSAEIAKRLRATVPPQVLHDPDDPKSPPPPNPMDDPAVQIEMASKEADIENKRMATAKTRAEIAKLEADAGLEAQRIQLEFFKATQIADSVAPKGPQNDNAIAGPMPPMPTMPPDRGGPIDGQPPFDPAAMPPVQGVPPPGMGASEMPPGIV